MRPAFGLDFAGDGNQLIAVVHGALDAESSSTLRDALFVAICDGQRDIVVDLEDLASIDSAGLGAIVAILKRMQAAKGELVLRSPTPHVLRVLESVGLDRILPIQRLIGSDSGAAG